MWAHKGEGQKPDRFCPLFDTYLASFKQIRIHRFLLKMLPMLGLKMKYKPNLKKIGLKFESSVFKNIFLNSLMS